MNQPCRPYEWFMSHIHEPTTSHFTYEFVIWHSCARHIMHADESCHTCEQVMLRICNGHVTRMEKSCHTHERVMSHMQTQSNINCCDTYATYCNTLRRTATLCNTLQRTATLCSTLRHTATHTGSQLPQLFQPFPRSSVEATDTATHTRRLKATAAVQTFFAIFSRGYCQTVQKLPLQQTHVCE